MPDRLTWASTIGLIILNFSTLDLHVQDYLENHLPEEEFARLKNRHFADRIGRIQQTVHQPGFPAEKRRQFERWSSRLEPIREIRNHIAHGLLRQSLADDQKNWVVTVSLPRDMAGRNSLSARHLTLEDLLQASKELVDLIEEFTTWDGGCTNDAEITC